MRQKFNNYTEKDHAVWRILFERQRKNLVSKAAPEYLDALDKMQEVLHAERIVRFDALNSLLLQETGWQIEVVKGLIPVEQFFQLLSEKKFCSSTWLRTIDQLDYLEEPDMFHDIFGHIPLLIHPVFAHFMEEFGKLGVQHSHRKEHVVQLQRLYWFTIEFGLIQTQERDKIYGAGILSSYGETAHVFQSGIEKRPFDIQRVIHHPFRTDEIQNCYYVIPSFEALFSALTRTQLSGFSPSYSYFGLC